MVVWWRSKVRVQEDSEHITNQVIVNTSHVTVYENTLTIRAKEGGRYHCSIGNNFGDFFNYYKQSIINSSIVNGIYSMYNHLYKFVNLYEIMWSIFMHNMLITYYFMNMIYLSQSLNLLKSHCQGLDHVWLGPHTH